MANDAEKRVRFDRVISALRGVIDSLTAQELAWEELKKGTVGVYAGSAIACSKARQALEDETPTMDALVIALRDSRYKDPTWPEDGEDDAKTLRLCWYSIHKTIETGKSFAPDDVPMMQNLCAALERARTKYCKAKGVGRPKGASLSKYETECLSHYQAGKKPSDIDEMTATNEPIRDWKFLYTRLIGWVGEGDQARMVRTSPVISINGDVATTRSGSTYVLGECHPDRSRQEWVADWTKWVRNFKRS